jgi:clan AA aspartic protease (TIGR02281 family)
MALAYVAHLSRLGSPPYLHQVLLIAGALLLLAPVQASGQVITVSPGPTGVFRLPVTLHGRMAVNALVDTGASAVVICSERARSLGLKRGEAVEITTANGRAPGWRVVLLSIVIETITLWNVPAIEIDNRDCEEIVLGMSALGQLRTVVLSGGTLALFGPPIASR